MKIENNRKSRQVDFADLDFGECFEFASDLYLRTGSVYNDIEGDIKFNSVMLKNGALTCFGDSDLVKIVNAKIVVE